MRKCTDGKWYMLLGNFEYAHDVEDCTFYGPFESLDDTNSYLADNFANPGAVLEDDEGTFPVPVKVTKPITSADWSAKWIGRGW